MNSEVTEKKMFNIQVYQNIHDPLAFETLTMICGSKCWTVGDFSITNELAKFK